MSDNDAPMMAIARGADPAREAAEWLARMASSEISEAETAAFGRWIAVPANAAAYDKMEELWGAFGAALDDGDAAQQRPRDLRFAWFNARVAALAATIALAVGGSWQYVAIWQYDLATRGAEVAEVTLGDGTRVTLNTGSAINYSYHDGVRHVSLAKGEAFFDVKRDPKHPFMIEAGGAKVTVLGTAFSVRRDSANANGTVIVQRGKVRVETSNGRAILTPNQGVAFDAAAISSVRSVEAANDLAWSRGRLIFHDRPLGEVIAKLDQYESGLIILSNEKLARKRVTAVVEIDRIDDWLSDLRKSQNAEVRNLPGLTWVS